MIDEQIAEVGTIIEASPEELLNKSKGFVLVTLNDEEKFTISASYERMSEDEKKALVILLRSIDDFV